MFEEVHLQYMYMGVEFFEGDRIPPEICLGHMRIDHTLKVYVYVFCSM